MMSILERVLHAGLSTQCCYIQRQPVSQSSFS